MSDTICNECGKPKCHVDHERFSFCDFGGSTTRCHSHDEQPQPAQPVDLTGLIENVTSFRHLRSGGIFTNPEYDSIVLALRVLRVLRAMDHSEAAVTVNGEQEFVYDLHTQEAVDAAERILGIGSQGLPSGEAADTNGGAE